MKEFIKICVAFSGYFLLAPYLGAWLSKNRTAERVTLCLLACMPSWFPSKLTLMLDSVEFYRGHTKGFEFSIMVFVGIALTVSASLKRPPGFRLLPPGLWLYLVYCFLSTLSVLPAVNKVYALMAAWKFTTAVMVFVGAYHGFQDREDLKWVARTLCITLMVQAVVCFKLRFIEARWQVHGWFEHQNPMCMWAYLCALPLLGLGLSKHAERKDTVLILGGLAGTAAMILLSVSRAGLAAFAIGSAGVMGLSYLRGLSAKKVAFTGLSICGAAAAAMLAMDSLMARINENASRENEEDLRPILNRQSKAMLQYSPFGIGWNNFGVVNSLPDERYVIIMMDWDESRGFRIYDENYMACPLTESLYWLLLSETGYPGFFSYLAFMAAPLWWSVRGLIRFWNTGLGNFLGGVVIALCLTYLHGTVERVLSQTKNLSIWLIFSGFMARVEVCRRQGLKDLPTPYLKPA